MKVNKDNLQNIMIDDVKKSWNKSSSDMMARLMSTDNLLKANKMYQPFCNIYRKTNDTGTDSKQEKNIINNYYDIKKEDDEEKEEEKEKEESLYNNYYLSLYDLGNLKKINHNRRNYINNNQNNNYQSSNISVYKSKFEQLHKSYDLNKNNFLNLRRSVSELKKGEYLNLIERKKI